MGDSAKQTCQISQKTNFAVQLTIRKHLQGPFGLLKISQRLTSFQILRRSVGKGGSCGEILWWWGGNWLGYVFPLLLVVRERKCDPW